jgi:hypothetical protein
MVFACDYVLFCKRDTRVINILSFFSSFQSQQKAGNSQVIKSAPTHKTPLSYSFLSRPRVVIKQIAIIDFALMVIAFLTPFIFFSVKAQFSKIITTSPFFRPCPDIIFYQNWRI